MLWGMFPLKASSCLPDSSSSLRLAGTASVVRLQCAWGVAPGEEGQAPSSGPRLTSQKRRRRRRRAYGPLGRVWRDDVLPPSLAPPSLCSSHHPMLQPPSGHHVASSSPRWAVTSRRTTLTSQGVLGHTEAQGLQPVVDVRFGHRKLEFCRAQRVMLVTETLRTQRKFVQRHLG